ncbi:hypothetical protein TR51_25690 [Kitasatospora griseola]|uniref:Uncharacterized protein n=1 Tax=Kitasatospora griseola TaxID=2064 RepID=A0A0D0NQR8_KITGR|nr:hypothetical protein [Kitasatospora griseola]KIQ61491.1 hypothetical protein TR51_35575 [Kitasatospora griseola]KIQ62432.1 hypothetical protein TR51_25690 [Kitasatospora griseola]
MEINLTADNLDAIRKGDIIEGAEDLGPVRAVRLAVNEPGCVRISGKSGWDLFGLPVTLTVRRSN